MRDEAEASGGAATEEPLAVPYAPVPPRRRSARTVLLIAAVAFLMGGVLAGWLVWRGYLDIVLPARAGEAAPGLAEGLGDQRPSGREPPTELSAAQASAGLGSVETRLALLEDRFSRIGVQANAAGANASRAEALLIALAARRRIDRGEPLGYVEDQLKLRFGGAQPQAVRTIIAASRDPITLHLLSSQLEAAGPELAGARTNESTWERIRRELATLFVVRRTASPAANPLERVERAQLLLQLGKIDDAIAEVERLPGAEDAQDWIAAARRYDDAQRALDLIETSAMLEPRQLRDGTGEEVDQPSPLAPPAEAAEAAN